VCQSEPLSFQLEPHTWHLSFAIIFNASLISQSVTMCHILSHLFSSFISPSHQLHDQSLLDFCHQTSNFNLDTDNAAAPPPFPSCILSLPRNFVLNYLLSADCIAILLSLTPWHSTTMSLSLFVHFFLCWNQPYTFSGDFFSVELLFNRLTAHNKP